MEMRNDELMNIDIDLNHFQKWILQNGKEEIRFVIQKRNSKKSYQNVVLREIASDYE